MRSMSLPARLGGYGGRALVRLGLGLGRGAGVVKVCVGVGVGIGDAVVTAGAGGVLGAAEGSPPRAQETSADPTRTAAVTRTAMRRAVYMASPIR
jgi:hypothetical protein